MYETNSRQNDSSYIKPWDTNKTLELTFKFIENHQIKANGDIIETSIFLGFSLKEGQSFNNYNNLKGAYNVIYGEILKVKESYLVMKVVSNCKDEYQEYTIAYSDINSFKSEALSKYFDEYIALINSLPYVDMDSTNKYYNLLQSLEKAIEETPAFDNLYIIYNGHLGSGYKKSDYYISRNLLLIQKSYVIPVTSINGFFTTYKKIYNDMVTTEGGNLNEYFKL